jgi:transcriptional regulator with XRE-family HTH domain
MSTKERSKPLFAVRLTYAMDLRDLGPNELENLAGMSRGHASRMQHGKRGEPGWELANKIASALNVRTCWLLGGEEPMVRAPQAPTAVAELPQSNDLTRPKSWPGFAAAADAILLDLKKTREYTPYYGSVMWFAETPTEAKPPANPMTAEALLPLVRAFYATHKNDPEMSDWQKRAAQYHQKNKQKPSTRPQPLEKTR